MPAILIRSVATPPILRAGWGTGCAVANSPVPPSVTQVGSAASHLRRNRPRHAIDARRGADQRACWLRPSLFLKLRRYLAPHSACRRPACRGRPSSSPARRRRAPTRAVRRLLRCLLARCDEMGVGRLRRRWLRGSTHAERLSGLSDAWEAPLIEMAGGSATRGDTGAVPFKTKDRFDSCRNQKALDRVRLLSASVLMPLASTVFLGYAP